MSENIDIETGSGNVFEDLDLPNPEEHMAKALLARAIRKEIERRGLSQRAAADLLGLKQPDVSNVVRGNLLGFSLERLADALVALGHQVEIHVTPPAEGVSEPGRLIVHA